MQITHNGKTYTMDDELASSVIKQLKGLGFLVELIETKPEEKLTEEILGMDVSEDNTVTVSGYTVKDGPVVITKIEEKPTECLSHGECAYMKNGNLLCTLCDKDCRIIRAEDKPDHDKAMEIPDVPLYQRENEWNRGDIEGQLELLTTAVNKLIKSHKK